MKTRFVLILALTVSVGLSTAQAESAFPRVIAYQGHSQDARGLDLNGSHQVVVKILDPSSRTVLASESHPAVVFDHGAFELDLGRVDHYRLDRLSEHHPELLLEFVIDGEPVGPWVRMKPSGHSPRSTLAAAGADTGDGRLHTKGFTKVSQATAFQSGVLRPQDAKAVILHQGDVLTRPFTVPTRGPMISPPLASMPTVPNRPKAHVDQEVNRPRHEILFDSDGNRFGTTADQVDDALAERARQLAGGVMMTPSPIVNVPGITNVNGVLPPDTEGAVGPDHYVQMVNLSTAVFDKSGSLLGGPFNTNQLWAGFGGPCEVNNNGDAIALYDQQADRWVLSQFAISGAQSVCFAVSTTPDPLGTYFLYELQSQRFPDYYKLGVWPDADNNAYFLSTNSGFPGGYDLYAIDRENLLLGNPARAAQFFQSFPNLLMPADHDGTALPPAGSPGLLYTIRDGGEPYFNNPATDSIDLYEYDVDWANPGASTLTLVRSIAPPEITDFVWTICGFFESSCLDQPGTAINLDSNSWWPMQRFQYRNFGTYEVLLGTWTVDTLANGDHAAPRWFELRRGEDPETVFNNGFEDGGVTGDQWSVFQEGTHAPDGSHRWTPSISMNGSGDIALSYSVVSEADTIFPSIRYAGRRPSDPAGILRDENSLIDGGGAQTSASNRWGEYSSMDVDPADDCTFWFTTEYIPTTGNAPWATQIGSFRFPGCVAVSTTPSVRELCTTTDSTTYDLTLQDGFAGTTNLSVSGCPAGATCGFSVNPVVNPTTMSQLQLSNLGAAAGGSYGLTVTATDSVSPGITFDAPLQLNLFDAVPDAVTLTLPADAATGVSISTRVFAWNSSAIATEYTFELATDAGFTDIIETATVSGTSHMSNLVLDGETTYFWRVRPNNLCGDGLDSAVFSFTTAVVPGECPMGTSPVTVTSFDFEAGDQGWTHNAAVGGDTWVLSTANPGGGGTQHWHVDDVATESDQRLTSPAIVLPAGQSPLTFQFLNFQDIEAAASGCWDGGVLEVSTDGGANFTQIQNPDLLTDPYDGPFQNNSILFGENGWCGNPQAYLNSIVNLDGFAGQTVQIRFRIVTDGAVSAPGWDIDDVVIQGCQ